MPDPAAAPPQIISSRPTSRGHARGKNVALFLLLYGILLDLILLDLNLNRLAIYYAPPPPPPSSSLSSTATRRRTAIVPAALSLPPTPAAPANRSSVEEGPRDFANAARPKFVLHVGIPKTGTTFLQCSLCSQANVTEPLLLKDQWIYLGTCPYEACDLEQRPPQFLRHSQSSFMRGTTLDPSFTEKVELLRGQERNVLVIFEGLHRLGDGQIRALSSFLEKAGWDVHVLVAYRPLYQWLPSKYNSQTKRLQTLREWPGRPVPHTDMVGEKWMPFDLHHNGTGGVLRGLTSQISETQQHRSETVLRNYAAHFSSTAILPLHDLPPTADPGVDPLLHYLFCVLWRDGSPCVCDAVRERKIGNDIPGNPSAPINYDMLATAAYEAGVIDPSTTLERREVGKKIRRRQERELNLSARDFPLACLPNRTLDELKNLSWRLERRLFPEEDEEKARQKHDGGFARSVASGAFCWIDANRTLSDPTWRSFLENQLA